MKKGAVRPTSSSVPRPTNVSAIRRTSRKSAPVILPKRTSIPKTPPSPSSSQKTSRNPPSLSTSSSSAATASNTQNKSDLLSSADKERTENSFPVAERSISIASSDAGPQEKALTSVSANSLNFGDYDARDKTIENSINSNADSEAGIGPGTNLVPADGQEVKAVAGVETLVGSEMPAADVDVVTTVLEGGKKKVIKRVKVVKKVVKRVIKRVPKGSLKSLESESVSNVGNLNENVQNLESRLNVSEAMEIEKVDPSAIVSIEYQKFEPNDIAPLEVENECSKEIKVDSPQYGNISPFLEPVSPVGIVDPSAIVSLEYEKFEPNDIAPLGVENGGSKEIEVDSKKFGNISPFLEPVSPIGTLSEVPFIYNNDGNEGEGVENQIEDDKDHVHVDAVEDQIAAAREEGASEVEDFATEPVQNNSSGLSGVVALSGELEAVERRRRRQTEIFLGGLDKGAKEEDIRRVFERVGEVTEVRLLIDGKTGKNKGFAFVQFASANDAKKALATYPNVEICGKQCGTRPVEGNDTIFLGNINRKWKDDDVLRLLKDAGIERIYKVSIKANPKNIEQNRGFAFLELETSRDAQTAFNKLQKNDLLVKQMKIKVAWAEPLAEPDENEMLKVKSIYAEYLPTLWDEEKVKTFFKRFGEIESVSLSKNRPSSRRKDIAFVNYKSREAALACIKAFSHEQVDEDGSKLNVKVALANPQKRSKQVKHVSDSTGKELHKSKAKTPESILKFHQPTNYARATSRSNEVISEGTNSITNELICLLRQQASGRLMQAGSSDLNHHHSPSGSKRTVHQLGNYPLSSDPRGFPRIRLESSQLTGNRSSFSDHISREPLPYSQPRNLGYAFESSNGTPDYPHFQTREQRPFLGRSRLYRRF